MKQPPTSKEAEQGVLGCIMLNPESLDKATATLRPEDFFTGTHKLIFKAMIDISNNGGTLDSVTLYAHIEAAGNLDKVGGGAFIGSLGDNIPAWQHIDSYAAIVKDKSMRRSLIATARDIAWKAHEDNELPDMLDQAEQSIYAVTHNRSEKKIKTFQENVVSAFEKMNAIRKGKIPPGLMTGYYGLDDYLAGMHNGDLIILAARPGIGKTALALNIARWVTFKTRKTAVYYSLEMGVDSLTTRILCASASTDAQAIRKGIISDSDFDKMADKAMKTQYARLFIDNPPAMSIAAFKSKSRRMKSEHGIDLIIVDYLQLMRGDRNRNDNRETEVASIARGLKATATELDVPVLALSQLNRKIEDRSNPEPQLSDLRESGAIEQDADVILFIYQPKPEKDQLFKHDLRTIKIAKQRNGPVGSVDLLFQSDVGRFDNYEK